MKRDITGGVFGALTFGLIGAIFLDRGIEIAGEFIDKNVLSYLSEILKDGAYRDAKSMFQEEAQERTGITPNYVMLKETGPDHDKRFEVGVYIGSDLVARGEGASKQEAEQMAAEAGLEKKNWQAL